MINIGAYVNGSNKKIDMAIKYNEYLERFLKQGIEEKADFNKSIENLTTALR